MQSGSPIGLVTGASRGIGRGIAIELARLGYSVAINYVANRDAAEECATLCRQAAAPDSQAAFEPFQADIARAEDRARLVKSVSERFGWIDLLVNNAGIAPRVRADILQASEESFEYVLATNLKGPYFLTQAVANYWIENLAKRPSGRRKPKIVTISSISAYTASVNRGDYCLAKAGLAMLTKLFAARLAEHGINVYEIRPGIIATDMTSKVKDLYERRISEGLTPIRRWGLPEDVGQAVAAIAEDRFPFSTGEVFNVDGGFHINRL
jgi:NAD(P)-dependent dehydrogenase (short-subunit alcohol dehydrogenase family)